MMQKIDPARLVPMDTFAAGAPLKIKLAYAGSDNFCGERIYRPDARLWLHEDLAAMVRRAATLAQERHGCGLILYDGLRTVNAQEAMRNTKIVRDNPQWTAESTRMLSLPGMGGHPRGMAIDLGLLAADGTPAPMGTAFDELSPGGNGPDVNKSHRDYKALPDEALANRRILEDIMLAASRLHGIPLLPLPTEWWDFRLPPEIFNRWAPLSDEDLPPPMRMTFI